MPKIIVITGTNTGSGKTVLTGLLARHLYLAGVKVAALKPICSGGRDDARLVRLAAGNKLSLDEVNPWHFRAPLAPLLAARKEDRVIQLREVVTHVRSIAHQGFDVILVEGAGGLLSPMGDHFSTRELIGALGADMLIAARNELGVVNHVRLTLEAMPPLLRARARVALMAPRRETEASRTNAGLLAEFIGESHIVPLPWLARPLASERVIKARPLAEALAALI